MPLNFRKFTSGIKLKRNPSTATSDGVGDLEVISSNKITYHNGTTASPIVTEDHSATLTNKTLTSPDLVGPFADIVTGRNSSDLTLRSFANVKLNTQANGNVNIHTHTTPGLGSGAVNITSGTGGVNIVAGTIGDSNVVKVEDVSFKGELLSHPFFLRAQEFVFPAGSPATMSTASTIPIQISPGSNANITVFASGTGEVILGNAAQLNAKIQTYNPVINNNRVSFTSIVNTQSGANQTLTTTTSSYITLTNSGLTSVGGVSSTTTNGQLMLLTNLTGNSVLIVNEDTTVLVGDRITTGTAGNITLADKGSAALIYNSTSSRWQIVSITQASAIPTPSITTVVTSTVLTNSNDYVLVNGTGITITLPSALIPGKTFNIKKIFNDTVPVTIQAPVGVTIDGLSSVLLIDQYDSFTITTDGSNYFII